MKVKKTLANLYYIILMVFVVSVFLNYLDWQFYGYYTEKIIAWIWIVFTSIYVVVFWTSNKVKLYFSAIIGILALSLLPMAIPIFVMYYYVTTTKDYQQISLNNTYRIERTEQSVMAPTRVYIYERQYYLLERNIYWVDYRDLVEEVLNLEKFSYELLPDHDLRTTPIQRAKLIEKNSDSIGIEYQIMNTRKIIYHTLRCMGDH